MIRALQRISTKYMLLFAALMSVLMLLVLSLAGYLVFENTNRLRGELTRSFASVQYANDVKALQASAGYLSNRLFNPLFSMDISGLNEEIEQIRAWLAPEAIFILDRTQRVVTDGTAENPSYGSRLSLPRNLTPGNPVVQETDDGQVIHFSIGHDGQVLGYARIELSDARGRALVAALHGQVESAWQGFERGFRTIAFISMALIGVLSLILGQRLSVSLSRPLVAMSHAAEQFAAGNLSHKLPDWSQDELGRLARSLNTMASELDKAGTLLNRAQEIAAFGSWEARRNQGELSLSYGVYNLLGVSPREFRPTVDAFLQFVSDQDKETLSPILQGRVEDAVSVEFVISHRDGTRRSLFLKGEPIRDSANRLVGCLGTLQDVTEQRRSREQLLYLANYDHLTRLPNRNLFYDRLRHAAKRARRRRRELALLFLDLDRFKAINDALGHDVGDELLTRVAQRLKTVVRESDTLARMGGDEFTLIVEDVTSDLAPQRIAQDMLDALTETFRINGRDLFISGSIGIAIFPRDADSVDTLIKNADTAMYVAKEQGRSVFRFFTPELDLLAHQRLVLEHELRRAVESKAFELHLQPQVRCRTGELAAVEVLLRWRRGGVLSPPGEFIPVLEDTGQITRITGWILQEACTILGRLDAIGCHSVRIAVNLSARQFQQPELPRLIDEALAECRVHPDRLELEITESTLLDLESSRKNAAKLAERGVRLALDDFGTGYSSLHYLKRYHVDTIKIDKSFVGDMLHDADDAQITATVIALARGLGLDCIAEGVENQAQFDRLRDLGCDLVQGYLMSRPVDLNGLLAWIASQQHKAAAYCWSGPIESTTEHASKGVLERSGPNACS